ncbi:hypothetical protein J3492_02585 [Psychrobacter sp. F1192]|uniref:Energy transducer TonB n=1 Tax=Psychrobacter coccoides TaxID=2818440 RepID=A0ABS3NLX7_9GAMM|nr:hypothetical protein [Psychrobacter coccoides]MBO1530098.1 hypothetical protein [Psychrobacter coccoides]
MTKQLFSLYGRKANNGTTLAIALALLLHIIIGFVIYFALFDPIESETAPPTHERPGADSISNKSWPSISIKTSSSNDYSHSQEYNNLPDTAKTTVDTKNTLLSNNKTSTASTDDVLFAKTKTAPDLQPNTTKTPSKKHTPPSLITDDSAESAANGDQKLKANDTPQLNLEYQSLADDIDKDSEQLSTLINEIKQRNQQQIDMQQALMLETQPKHEATSKPKSKSEVILAEKEPVSGLTYAYPTTPTADLQKTDDLR